MEYSIDKVVITDPYYRLRAKSLARIHAFPAELLEDACEKKGFSEIHKIVWGISYEDLDTKVRACPEALDRQDSYGYTPLDYAVRFGKRNHVRVLLSHGADVGSRSHSLFLIALEFGEYASVQLLVDRGLRLNDLRLYAQDDEDNDSAFLSDNSPVRYSRRWNGYCNSASYVMDNYLTDYGFDFKMGACAPDGMTVLMSFCRRPSSHIVTKQMKALLEHGVDIEVTDDYGQTAIHHTLYSDNLLALEMLIEYGARLDARTSKAETVLHMAARMTEGVAMVRALSKAGIMQLDLNAPLCYRGDTAFDVLRRRAAETKVFSGTGTFPRAQRIKSMPKTRYRSSGHSKRYFKRSKSTKVCHSKTDTQPCTSPSLVKEQLLNRLKTPIQPRPVMLSMKQQMRMTFPRIGTSPNPPVLLPAHGLNDYSNLHERVPISVIEPVSGQ